MSLEVWTEERKALALASAERWHGTPHMDFLAIPGKGVDCIHLLTEILFDANIAERKELGRYNPSDGLWTVSRKLVFAVQTAFHVEQSEPDWNEFGQIWVFRTGGRSGHVGIVLNGDLWHALAKRFVTKSDAKQWRREVDVAFRLVNTGWKTQPPAVTKSIS